MQVYIKPYTYDDKARIFVLDQKSKTVTIRTLKPIIPSDGVGANATDEQIQSILNAPGTPLFFNNTNFDITYPASMLDGFVGDSSTVFVLIGEICWKNDAALLGSRNVSDFASWTFHEDGSDKLSFMNRGLYTLPERSHWSITNYLAATKPVATIMQPYANSEFDDCLFVLYHNADKGYKHNFPNAQETEQSDFRFFPVIEVSGPSYISNGFVTVDVTVKLPQTGEVDARANTELFLEPIAGYLPKTRVKITDGQGSFKVSADGLDLNDDVRVKVGWKNWPGITEYTAKVI